MKTPIANQSDALLAQQYAFLAQQYNLWLVIWDGLNDEVLTNEQLLRTSKLTKPDMAKIRGYMNLIRDRQRVLACEGRILRRRLEEVRQELDRRGYPKNELEHVLEGRTLT